MNIYGKPRRKTTIWLGSDDGDKEGMSGYGYNITREDSMVSIEQYAGEMSERDEELQVFILPDLFPKIRKAMAAVEAQQRRKGGPKG